MLITFFLLLMYMPLPEIDKDLQHLGSVQDFGMLMAQW